MFGQCADYGEIERSSNGRCWVSCREMGWLMPLGQPPWVGGGD